MRSRQMNRSGEPLARWRSAAVWALAALWVVSPASAHIPAASRIVGAIAQANRASGRGQPLRLEVSLRIGDGSPVAMGELVTHPTGLARLELRGAHGLVERHLLQGTEHTASRNGRELEDPREFLPPLFLIQSDSALTLRTAFESFDVEVDAIGLAACGERDCYVVGDPSRVPPPPPPVGQGPAPLPERVRAEVRGSSDRSGVLPKVWIDIVTYEVRRMDFAGGVRVKLGPVAVFDEIQVPSWLEIDQPEHRPVRLEILRATAVNAPAAAFSKGWLFPADGAAPGPADPGFPAGQ